MSTQTQHIITTSPDIKTAREQAYQQITGINTPIFEEALHNDFESKHRELNALDRILHAGGYQSFSSRELTILRSFLVNDYYSSKPFIVSDAALIRDTASDFEVQLSGLNLKVQKSGAGYVINTFTAGDNVLKLRDKFYQQKIGANYVFIYTFASHHKTDGQSLSINGEVNRIDRPTLVVDHRILAKFSEAGLLDRLVEILERTIDINGHDYFHAATSGVAAPSQAINRQSANGKYLKVLDLKEIYERVGNSNENLALDVNSKVYSLVKHEGKSRELYQLIAQFDSLLKEFAEIGHSDEVEDISADLKRVFAYYVSNYVNRSLISEQPIENWPEIIRNHITNYKGVFLAHDASGKGGTRVDAIKVVREFAKAIHEDAEQTSLLTQEEKNLAKKFARETSLRRFVA